MVSQAQSKEDLDLLAGIMDGLVRATPFLPYIYIYMYMCACVCAPVMCARSISLHSLYGIVRASLIASLLDLPSPG